MGDLKDSVIACRSLCYRIANDMSHLSQDDISETLVTMIENAVLFADKQCMDKKHKVLVLQDLFQDTVLDPQLFNDYVYNQEDGAEKL